MSNIQNQLNNFLESALSDETTSNIEKSSIIKNVLDSKKAIEESEKTKADTINAKKLNPKKERNCLSQPLHLYLQQLH